MLKIHWFLPTGGDARDVLPDADDPHRRAPDARRTSRRSRPRATRSASTGCSRRAAPAARTRGSRPRRCIPLTRRVKFLVAFRPALLSPTLAAQMASTYQRLSDGRLLVNIVTGAEPAELARFGVWEDKETRYERTGEFVEIMRGAWSGEPFDYEGAHYHVDGATTRAAARTDAAHLLRRRVRSGRADRGRARRRVPRVGRTAGDGGGARRRACARLAADAGRDARLRHPLPRDRPPDRRRGVGGRRRAARAA